MANLRVTIFVDAQCGIHRVEFKVQDGKPLTRQQIHDLVNLDKYLDGPMICEICDGGQN